MNLLIKKRNYKDILTLGILSLPILLLLLTNLKDWFGIILIVLTLIYILTNKLFISNVNTVIAVLVVFFTKLVITLTNSYFFTIYGAEADATRFFRNAEFMSEFNAELNFINSGADLYESFLAFVFNLTGISKFGAEMLSILTFIIAITFLLKIAEKLYGNAYNTYLVYLFGLLPSMLIYTSITMREPYQILFFLMSIYYFLMIYKQPTYKTSMLFKFLISAFLLGLLHNGLLVFMFLLLLTYLFQVLRVTFKLKSFLVKATISMLILFGISFLLNLIGVSTPASDAVMNGDIKSYIDDYRDSGIAINSRAQYGIELNTSNLFTILYTLPLVFISYMAAPFPWQVSSIMDIYAMLENLMRISLVILVIKNIKNVSGKPKTMYNQLFWLFISAEVLWAMGTVNWGTATRHHLIAYGLILVLSAPFLNKDQRTVFNQKDLD